MKKLEGMLEKFQQDMKVEEITFNTIRNYSSDVRNFYNWCKGLNLYDDISKITTYHVNAYRGYIIHNKRKKTASVNRNIQSLRKFFGFLTKEKILQKNPALKVRFLKRRKLLRPQSLNKDEIHKLLSVTAHSSHGTRKRNYAIVQVILQTGIRVGELVNLEYRDMEIYGRSGQIRIVNGKGGKERVVPLNNVARRALSSYLKGQNKEEKELVFLSKRGGRITVRAVQQMVSGLARRAKIERVAPHVLRHTFAINYLRSNPECLVELGALLGHESLDTTSIYTIASKGRLEDTVEKTGNYINE